MTRLFLKVVRINPGNARFEATGLYPSDLQSREALRKLPENSVVRAEIKRPRHPGHHRKYWAMLGLVHEASNVSDLYPTVKKLHRAIKGALGYFEEVKLPDGKIFHVVDSIAFENMDQVAFEQFYDKAVALICEQVVPNMDRADLEREVMEMVK